MKTYVLRVLAVSLSVVCGVTVAASFASASTTISTNILTGGTLAVGTTTPWGRLSITGSDTSAATPAFVAADSNNNPIFSIFDNGNVGIGTTSPATTLSTQGNEYTTGGLGVGLLNATAGTIQSSGNILGGGTLALSGTTGTTTVASGQGFTIGGSQFVLQQGRGDVGIGTASPSGTLDVEGGTAAASTNGSNVTITAQNAGSGNQNGGDIFLNTGAGSGTGNSGDVGINQLFPSHVFHVKGTVGAGKPDLVYLEDWDATGTSLGIFSGGSSQTWEDAVAGSAPAFTGLGVGSYYILREGAAAPQFVINTSGNVGIGTTSPTSMFQVTTPSSNATTSIEIGKASQTKGSCLVMYDVTGAVQYVTIQGGALVVSSASCK